MRKMMQNIGMEGEVIQHRWVSKAIDNAQKKVEWRNFDSRKSLLEYDDVANDQRLVIYQQRKEFLESDDISSNIESIREDLVETLVSNFIPRGSVDEQWNVEDLDAELKKEFNLNLSIAEFLKLNVKAGEEDIYKEVARALNEQQDKKVSKYGEPVMRSLEKQIMLEVLDRHWKEHLARMDHLRQGIGLRGYAQKNPKQEYKKEAFELFQGLLDSIKYEVIQFLAVVEIRDAQEVEEMQQQLEATSPTNVELQHDNASAMGDTSETNAKEANDADQHFVR